MFDFGKTEETNDMKEIKYNLKNTKRIQERTTINGKRNAWNIHIRTST